MSRKLITSILVYGTALGLGLGFGTESNALRPKPVLAACHAANAACTPADPTKTSLLTVQHIESGVGAVLPTSGTAWSIVATWSQPAPNCGDTTETASATVSWDSSTASWVLSNVTLTTNIQDIQICNGAGCSGSASTYTMYVDITNAVGGSGHTLRKVDYSTSNVPNGTQCIGGASKTPLSSSASATDSGSFNGRCAYDCSQSGYPVITNYYQ